MRRIDAADVPFEPFDLRWLDEPLEDFVALPLRARVQERVDMPDEANPMRVRLRLRKVVEVRRDFFEQGVEFFGDSFFVVARRYQNSSLRVSVVEVQRELSEVRPMRPKTVSPS